MPPISPPSVTPRAKAASCVIDQLDALIFDVDGTLAETEEAHRLAFNKAFAEAGLDWDWTPDLYRKLLKVTGGKERIAWFMASRTEDPLAGREADIDLLIRRLHARKTELYATRVAAGAVTLRPGIEPLIREARRRDVRLAIATTTSWPNVEALIGAALGREVLGWFDAVACGDMAALKKPAPDVYDLALAALGIPAARAVAIEDSWNGVRAAKAAGLAVIATPSLYSANDDFTEADVVCEPHQIAGQLGWA